MKSSKFDTRKKVIKENDRKPALKYLKMREIYNPQKHRMKNHGLHICSKKQEYNRHQKKGAEN